MDKKLYALVDGTEIFKFCEMDEVEHVSERKDCEIYADKTLI